MRLLILTQKVDMNDAMLGFFHQWIIKFSEHYENTVVICLEEGEHQLPETVTVCSLGKEKATFFKKSKYTFNFYKYIWQSRENYDTVFVHMNPEYMVLGGTFWRLWGKKVVLWYNHKEGGVKALIGMLLAHRVFYTSTFAFMSRFKKACIMPAGVDADSFTPDESVEKKPNSILSLGRISPVKHVEVLIDALLQLEEKGVSFTASFYGDPTPKDMLYYQDVRRKAKVLERKGRVTFYQGVPNRETPSIYRTHEFFINATPQGSFDKTVLEAAACGAIPIVENISFKDVLPAGLVFKEGDAGSLANAIALLFTMSPPQRDVMRGQLRKQIVEKHSLTSLTKKIVAILG